MLRSRRHLRLFQIRRLSVFFVHSQDKVRGDDTPALLVFFVFGLLTSVFLVIVLNVSWLDGKHVVFGKVIAGQDVVSAIEQVGSESGTTRVPVVIADSGQLR